MSDIDKALAEIDLLAVADAVGVYRSGPVELGPVDPRVGDTTTQRGARQKQARQRATGRHQRGRNVRALDEHLDARKYPDVATTYPPVSLRAGIEPTEDQVRQAANDLVAQGWPAPIVARLLNITPRSPQ